jgi:CheY-like chemotaxis protein
MNASARTVVLVDNDDVMRAGAQVLLGGHDEIHVVASLTHDGAMAWDGAWSDVDVVLLDAADPQRAGDQFPGVAVARHIRTIVNSTDAPRIVVVTGQFFHDGLRRRMVEAGVDAFASRWDGMRAEDLWALVLDRESVTPVGSLRIDAPPELGITAKTSVNRLVDELEQDELHSVLDGAQRKRHAAHGDRSRWWNVVRQRFAGPQGLEPRGGSGQPQLDLDMPSVPKLRRFAAWATRTDQPPKP